MSSRRMRSLITILMGSALPLASAPHSKVSADMCTRLHELRISSEVDFGYSWLDGCAIHVCINLTLFPSFPQLTKCTTTGELSRMLSSWASASTPSVVTTRIPCTTSTVASPVRAQKQTPSVSTASRAVTRTTKSSLLGTIGEHTVVGTSVVV